MLLIFFGCSRCEIVILDKTLLILLLHYCLHWTLCIYRDQVLCWANQKILFDAQFSCEACQDILDIV